MANQLFVVGGGVAGLAAALRLAEAGRRVTLFEAGPQCGGRCRSYFDRELGCRIDNGNHLLLSGNDAAMAFLQAIGTRDSLGGPDKPVFPFFDLASGARWTVRPNLGALPWWVFRKSRGVPGAGPRQFLGLLRLLRAGASETVAGALPRDALYTRLIEPLAIAALNTLPEEGSARLLWAVVAGSLARGGAQCVPCFPRVGLSESFIDPAVARIAALGGTVRTGRRIAGLRLAGGQVAALETAEGDVGVSPEDRVILAVPASIARQMHPALKVPDAFEAILNLHFKLDAPFGEAGFVGLIGGLAEWVFIKPGIVSVTISAANRYLDMPPEILAARCWREVCAALQIVAGMPPYRLIRERRATFAATPAQQQRRNSATTDLPNLFVAGDWTDTGLPATIEGAIRSGFAAARQVLVG